MKAWAELVGGIAAVLIAFVAFMAALAAGFGAFTPAMSPWWLIVTIPAGLLVAAAIAATALKVAQWVADR